MFQHVMSVHARNWLNNVVISELLHGFLIFHIKLRKKNHENFITLSYSILQLVKKILHLHWSDRA